MDQFDEAIICSHNPNISESLRNDALKYITQVKESPEGWIFCLDKFFRTNSIEVKFFCLTVLQETILYRYSDLTKKQLQELKSSLWSYLSPNNLTNEDTAIKNKFSQVLVLLFRAEYPHSWPSFFSDLINLLTLGIHLVDIFLRIMRTIDEEVLSREMPRNVTEVAIGTQIKDYIRENSVQDIVNTWYGILTSYTSSPEIMKDCLDIMKRYINWIDINLIANDRFIPLFYKFFSLEVLREKACECIYEVVSKGMEPLPKLTLLQKLNLNSILTKISMTEDPDFLDSVADIINVGGIELIESITKVEPMVAQNTAPTSLLESGKLMLEEFLVLLFQFMNCDDNDISQTTFDFAGAYLNWLKQLSKNGRQLEAKQIDSLKTFLQIIRNKMKYKLNHDFTKAEEDNDFREYRQSLSKLYKAITALSPQLVAQFVHATMTETIQNFNRLPFIDVEVAIYLFQSIADGIPQSLIQQLETFFSQMIAILCSSDLSTYPHQAVTLCYFDTVVRYSRYFPNDPEVLKKILISFLDGRGVRHPNPSIRSRVCYSFTRLIKAQLNQFQLFSPSILQSLNELISANQRHIPFDDKIQLLDAAGTLVGQATSNVDQQNLLLDEICSPYVRRIEEILEKELYKSDTVENPIYTTILCEDIGYIGTFSKGFNNHPGNSVSFFEKSLPLIIRILHVLPTNENIRSKVIFFMHRMIECLGKNVLSYLPSIIGQLMINCGTKDLIEFIRLINQLTSRFKELMFSVIDELLLKIITRIFGLITESQAIPNSELIAGLTESEREIGELRRNYYLLLSNVVCNNLANVLKTPNNSSKFNDVMLSVAQGCQDSDPVIAKTCFIIIKKLIENWAGNDANSVYGFNDFIFQKIVPIFLNYPLQKNFDLKDASFQLILNEIISIQLLLAKNCGSEFISYMKTLILPQYQIPQDLIQQYIQFLQNPDNARDFKIFYNNFVSNFKLKS